MATLDYAGDQRPYWFRRHSRRCLVTVALLVMLTAAVVYRATIGTTLQVLILRRCPIDGPWVRLAAAYLPDYGCEETEVVIGRLGIRYCPLLEDAKRNRESALRLMMLASDAHLDGAASEGYGYDLFHDVLPNHSDERLVEIFQRLPAETQRRLAFHIAFELGYSDEHPDGWPDTADFRSRYPTLCSVVKAHLRG